MIKQGYIKNLLAALLCMLIVLSFAVNALNMPIHWGDDSAAYISDGIAMHDGSYAEKIKLNYFMHPSQLPEEADQEKLVYSWGFPLLLSGIYSAVGFDREDYHTAPYYMLPGIICLAALGFVLYLFYRRRFAGIVSVLLSVVFCLNSQLLLNVSWIYSDVPFLFFVMLTFLVMEQMNDKLLSDQGKGKVLYALLLGLLLFCTREMRLNGNAVVAIVFLCQLFCCIKKEMPAERRKLFLIPYMLFFALSFLAEKIFFYSPTSNASDISFDAAIIANNAKQLLSYFREWLECFPLIPGRESLAFVSAGVLAVLLLLLIVGAVVSFRKNLHYILLLAGTMAVLLMLPYTQGVRYFFHVLPIAFLLAYTGFDYLWTLLRDRLSEKQISVFCSTGALLSMIVLAAMSLSAIKDASDPGEGYASAPYAPESIEVYGYIQNNTPSDSVICFYKPRALYLNTQRKSFRLDVNGHSIDQADYVLVTKGSEGAANQLVQAQPESFEPLFENNNFIFYECK